MRNDAAKSAIAVTGAFLLVLATGTLGWALLRGDSTSTVATWTASGASPSGSPTADPVVTTNPPPVVPTTAKTSKPPPTKKKVVPKTTASQPPDTETLPVVHQDTNPSCSPTKNGADASTAEVKAALVAAASRKYWDGVVPDPALPENTPRPVITIPADLMKAVAWQESGWQSAIVSCDGGVGVMQIQTSADTNGFVNLRFGENLDVNTLSGNAAIGAAYMEYLIMWFGIRFFGVNFDLSVVAPVGPSGEQYQLLDVVLAAYNFGANAIVVSIPQHTLSIPTKAMTYVNNVKALRASTCPCQNF